MTNPQKTGSAHANNFPRNKGVGTSVISRNTFDHLVLNKELEADVIHVENVEKGFIICEMGNGISKTMLITMLLVMKVLRNVFVKMTVAPCMMAKMQN